MRQQYFRGKVFVANLPPDFDDERLAEAFDDCGMVLSAFVARDPDSGKRLRYGFVDIATDRAANLAVEKMNGTEIDGHKLDVRISEKPSAPRKTAAPRTVRRTAAPPRPVARPEDLGEGTGYAAYPTPRKRPQFQVERRALPRRI